MADERYVNERILAAGLELAEQTARADTNAHDPITRIKAWATLRALERGREYETLKDFADVVVNAVDEHTGGKSANDLTEGRVRSFTDEVLRGAEIYVRTQAERTGSAADEEKG